MTDNLIFLTDAELDKSVYRIFSFSRLEEIFTEKKLTLVKPKKWDDPFENFILNSKGVLPDGRHFEMGFRDNFYGQCWSLTRESDALWRIYSPGKEVKVNNTKTKIYDGVKVKTTIRKLFTPLFDAGGHYPKWNGTDFNVSSFVGKVKYESQKSLIEMLKDEKRMSNKIFDQSGWGQASTFFFKRAAFKHENEVRIIFYPQNPINSDCFKFDIDPKDLFDEIVFDPRMEDFDYEAKKAILLSWGYNKKINQSELYKLKQFTVALRPI